MASRDLSAARAAYRDRDASIAAHSSPQEVEIVEGERLTMAPEAHKKAGTRMKAMLFGGLDGVITTFAVVAGAGGGGLSPGVVLIMGVSSLIADALSMGVGDALSSKAEAEVALREAQREAWELDNFPEGEVREMVEIYVARGVALDDATSIVEKMAKYPSFFVDVMMRDELGMEPVEAADIRSWEHWKSGLYCFTAFFICGSVPLFGYVALLPVLDDPNNLFLASCLLTAAMLFLLGAMKSNFTTRTWYASGAEVRKREPKRHGAPRRDTCARSDRRTTHAPPLTELRASLRTRGHRCFSWAGCARRRPI